MGTPITALQAALRDRYLISGELGRGGMATVYLATDLRHDRQVALKVLNPEATAVLGRERFLSEIRATANLQHPHILPLHDSGAAGELLYYVMPYVEGETLRQRLDREGRVPAEEALSLGREVADALDAAHARGLVHRDIKPENILLSGGHAFVADFGIAWARHRPEDSRLTGAGTSLGTPHYMSPEQIAGDEVDGRSDVYSLGCVIYEMLCGVPPFQGHSSAAVLAGHVAGPIPRLRVPGVRIGSGLEGVVLGALAKSPDGRFGSAREFGSALTAVDVRRPNTRWRSAVGVILGAALAASAVWVFPGVRSIGGSRDRPDGNRIMVFPLVVAEDYPGSASAGEDFATLVGNALDGAGALRWIDGWTVLPPELRNNIRGLSEEEAARLALARGCGYYLAGRISPIGDSAVVSLVLHDLLHRGDPRRAQATVPVGEAWRGVVAVNGLLPTLIPSFDAEALDDWEDRPPRALASFLLGEQAFRRLLLTDAVGHFRRASDIDSTFAMAAIRGAQVASWLHEPEEAASFLETALRQPLSPKYEAFALGSAAYLEGRADSALARLRRAVELDGDFTAAWLQLGETWVHLLPEGGSPEDSALAAFSRVIAADSSAVNASFHVIEILLRRGDLASARAPARRLLETDASETYREQVQIMLDCLEGAPETLDWDAIVRARPFALFAASLQLAGGGAQLPCATAGLEAALRADTLDTPDSEARRFFVLLTLHAALLAQGREEDAFGALQAYADRWGTGSSLFLLSAPEYRRFAARAAEVTQDDEERHGSLVAVSFSIRLWELGVYHARIGSTEAANAIAAELERRSADGEDPAGVTKGRSIRAHLALRFGQDAVAFAVLDSLVPAVASSDALRYDEAQPWALERLEYARLLAQRGDYRRAIDVADIMDSPWPVVHLLYLRPSLELRLEAAEALGDRRLAARYRERLARLGAQ